MNGARNPESSVVEQRETQKGCTQDKPGDNRKLGKQNHKDAGSHPNPATELATGAMAGRLTALQKLPIIGPMTAEPVSDSAGPAPRLRV